MTRKRKWSELSSRERVVIVLLAVLQIGLLAAAQRDLARREADEVNGPKRLWRLLCLINFAGPIAYFAVGRKRHT